MAIKTKIIRRIFVLLSVLLMVGCDMQRHDECEWYLVPEPRHIKMVEEGWVSICARNYVTNKEKCYLRLPIDKAENVFGKTVTFSSLKLDSGMIKEIKSYKTCEPSSKEKKRKANQ